MSNGIVKCMSQILSYDFFLKSRKTVRKRKKDGGTPIFYTWRQ